MGGTDLLKREAKRAVRALARSPGFTVIVLITLALGIGATVAIFTILDRVVLRPLAYHEADQLVWIDLPTPGVKPDSRWGLSVADFYYFKKNSRTLQNIGVYGSGQMTVEGTVSAERVSGVQVSASLFDVLRLRPALGRVLTPDDNRPNAAPVVVLGYNYWKRRSNGNVNAVGSVINVEGIPMQVIGVLQPGADIPDAQSHADLWLPLQLDPYAPARNAHGLETVGRLAPNATIDAARTDLLRLTAELPRVFPTVYTPSFLSQTHLTTEMIPLRDRVIGDLATRLWILLGAVVLVLIIAFANVANLFLVRTEARRREIAIRSVLGAKRIDLARHYIAESMLVSFVAGIIALVIAFVGIRAMVAIAPPGFPRLDEIHLDWPSVLFTGLVSLAAGTLFGLLTLASTGKPAEDVMMIREGGRGQTLSRRQRLVRGALVAAQTALALVLLAASGLLLQSFSNMRSVSPGFDSHGVLTAEVDLPSGRYRTYEQTEAFYHELLTRAAAIPGVQVAGAGDVIPLAGQSPATSEFGICASVFTEEHPVPNADDAPCVSKPLVAPGYFRALGIKLRGQEPGWSDVESHAGGVVVTKALAARLWPGEDPIGKGITSNSQEPPFYRVVGVTEQQLRGSALDQPPSEAVFYPLLPMPGTHLWGPPQAITVLLRSSTVTPEVLTASLRRVVKDIDPNVPIGNIQTMDAVVAQSMTRLSFTMMLLAIAAIMALILSMVGMYGVISYIVGRRRAEIGIRIALGAQAAQVGRLVVTQLLRMTAVGVVLGLVGSLLITRVLRSVLFGVSPTDPAILGGVSVLILALAAAASYLPARRATMVDPAEALRAD